MKLANIEITGYSNGLKKYMLTNSIEFNNNCHTVENYWNLAKIFVKDDVNLTKSFIPFHENHIKEGQFIVDNLFDFIVICPYATNKHKCNSKEWGNWVDLISKTKNVEIICLVEKSDYDRCIKEFHVKVFTLSLGATAYVMTKAKCVLTNDSGAMHLASFFGANIVGILGITEEHLTRPWYGKYVTGEQGFPDTQKVIDFIQCYL
jgi:ADP-heptose:LPS heptosyltransferase